MNAGNRWLLLLPIAALGVGIFYLNDRFFVTREGTFLKADLEARHEKARSDGRDAGQSGALPAIDFSLLDQTRPLDLIDMDLEFPESLKKLDGQRVSLVGFMAPFDSLNDMRRCMIVPSYVGCNFCSPPSLTQVVYVNQGTDDATTGNFSFIEEASHATGVLRLALPESNHEGQAQGFLFSLENAVVTPHTGKAPLRASGHGNPARSVQSAHQQAAMTLAPIAMEQLVQQVADLLGREPLRPIEFEEVSTERFDNLVRSELEAIFPQATRSARSEAFSLLAMLPEGADWIDALTEIELARHIVVTDEKGERIYLLDSVASDHPYLRLDLVGEIAGAIIRQHFPGDRTGSEGSGTSDDTRRSRDALLLGIQTVAVHRYTRSRGISLAIPFPEELIPPAEQRSKIPMSLGLWHSLPGEVGPFFVDFFVGATGPFSGIDGALTRPPTTTMELFRPRWYQDASLWSRDPVPGDFADDLMDSPPELTGVLGIGGLVPWLAKLYPVDAAKSLSGRWTGDRWAVWQFPDDSFALLLETRWQDEASALQFLEAIPNQPFQKVPPYATGSRTVRVLRGSSQAALEQLASSVKALP